MISRISRKLAYLYKVYFLKDILLISAKKWFKDQGDINLRLNYPLCAKSIVFDLGGYKGDFAAAISERYNCKVYLFEPSSIFYNECKDRFKNNKNIICYNFGLSSESKKVLLSNSDNASSTKITASPKKGYSLVELISFFEFLKKEGIEKIDLLKINIEGGEYDVLPHLIENNLMSKISHLQVQFHNFIENSDTLRNNIISKLSETHQQQWCYPFIWESWKIKQTS